MDGFSDAAEAVVEGIKEAEAIKDGADAAAVAGEVVKHHLDVKDELLAHIEANLGDAAWHKAVELIDDIPALLQHLEAQLPMAHFGTVQKLLGL